VKIVAVDDNADARAFIDRVLQLHGAKVVSVDSAAKAIEALLQFRPDIVLCDLMMPEMDGYAFLRQIRALGNEMASAVPGGCPDGVCRRGESLENGACWISSPYG